MLVAIQQQLWRDVSGMAVLFASVQNPTTASQVLAVNPGKKRECNAPEGSSLPPLVQRQDGDCVIEAGMTAAQMTPHGCGQDPRAETSMYPRLRPSRMSQ